MVANIVTVHTVAKAVTEIFASGITVAIAVVNVVARLIYGRKNGHNTVTNSHKSIANEENRI